MGQHSASRKHQSRNPINNLIFPNSFSWSLGLDPTKAITFLNTVGSPQVAKEFNPPGLKEPKKPAPPGYCSTKGQGRAGKVGRGRLDANMMGSDSREGAADHLVSQLGTIAVTAEMAEVEMPKFR